MQVVSEGIIFKYYSRYLLPLKLEALRLCELRNSPRFLVPNSFPDLRSLCLSYRGSYRSYPIKDDIRLSCPSPSLPP
eukprot:590396-Hanusia_phi.AAC.1